MCVHALLLARLGGARNHRAGIAWSLTCQGPRSNCQTRVLATAWTTRHCKQKKHGCMHAAAPAVTCSHLRARTLAARRSMVRQQHTAGALPPPPACHHSALARRKAARFRPSRRLRGWLGWAVLGHPPRLHAAITGHGSIAQRTVTQPPHQTRARSRKEWTWPARLGACPLTLTPTAMRANGRARLPLQSCSRLGPHTAHACAAAPVTGGRRLLAPRRRCRAASHRTPAALQRLRVPLSLLLLLVLALLLGLCGREAAHHSGGRRPEHCGDADGGRPSQRPVHDLGAGRDAVLRAWHDWGWVNE